MRCQTRQAATLCVARSIDSSLEEICGRPGSFAYAARTDSAAFAFVPRVNSPRAGSNWNSLWWREDSGWPVLAGRWMARLFAHPPPRPLGRVAVRLTKVVMPLPASPRKSPLRWNPPALPQCLCSLGQTCDLRAAPSAQNYLCPLGQRPRPACPVA